MPDLSTMAEDPVEDPGDRTEWILRLLYAPNSRGESRPLYGVTRLMKACFLIERKLDEEFDVETDFEFKPDKYGPFDQGVYVAVEQLEERGLIRDPENGDDHDTDLFELTDLGRAEAVDLWEDLPEGQQKLIEWVKYEHAMEKLGRLLTYVYNEYPDMTTKSVLK